jgi:hypothetical protein
MLIIAYHQVAVVDTYLLKIIAVTARITHRIIAAVTIDPVV